MSRYLLFCVYISIHLMLRFIKYGVFVAVDNYYFNTSHVKVYRESIMEWMVWVDISIHLMLRFIKILLPFATSSHPISIHLMLRLISSEWIRFGPPKIISIHLMLRFIPFGIAKTELLSDFNTSHVKVYRYRHINFFLRQHFNTSHVKVYLQPRFRLFYILLFQYISC